MQCESSVLKFNTGIENFSSLIEYWITKLVLEYAISY